MESITEIIHQFGVPNTIIIDNGTQFTAEEFMDFCEEKGIKVNFASVAHPQSNRQVEHTTDLILHGLKPRIFDRLKLHATCWVKELPTVMWAL